MMSEQDPNPGIKEKREEKFYKQQIPKLIKELAKLTATLNERNRIDGGENVIENFEEKNDIKFGGQNLNNAIKFLDRIISEIDKSKSVYQVMKENDKNSKENIIYEANLVYNKINKL